MPRWRWEGLDCSAHICERVRDTCLTYETATRVIYIVWNKTRAGEDYHREEVSFICVCYSIPELQISGVGLVFKGYLQHGITMVLLCEDLRVKPLKTSHGKPL